jgi:hypothetical protein
MKTSFLAELTTLKGSPFGAKKASLLSQYRRAEDRRVRKPAARDVFLI